MPIILKKQPTGAVSTVITDKRTKEIVAQSARALRLTPVTVEKELAGNVGAERHVSQSIEYQSISTKVWISMPCDPTVEAAEATYDTCFKIMEQVLEKEADNVATLMRTLVDIKRETERAK